MSTHISLMPHRVCWAADPHLVWTMVITNAITFLSYLSICITLLYMVRRTRRVIARDWAWFAVGFALFIVACGTTHLMDVVTTWVDEFWIGAWVSVITAVLSAVVAFMLIRRAGLISFSINDYADRLANTEAEKARLTASLLDARKLEDWSRMSTAVAHEIANPLEAVQNLLYLIRTAPGTSVEVGEMARAATEEADRVLRISRSTLDFFRKTKTPEPIDLKAAAEAISFPLATLFLKRDIRYVVEAEGNVTVEAFAGEVRQVLLNLVRNAADATMRTGTTITVKLTARMDEVEIIVADQGAGIPKQTLPLLFQFGVTTKGEAGNGMGLWTVKQLLTKHGGDVRVESILGIGTRFVLRWPRRYVEDARQTA